MERGKPLSQGQKAPKQITMRIAPHVKEHFSSYAAALGLNDSELAKLLVVRELKRKRLRKSPPNNLPQVQSQKDGKPLPTVTAHISRNELIGAFDNHAQECGLSRSAAGQLLLQLELSERWLERAILAD